MKANGGEEEDIIADINMTPFIDIMLVLLIIFMVTSSVSPESGLDVDLPVSGGSVRGDSSPSENPVIVTLLRDGSSAVQGVPVSSENLEGAIKKALADKKLGFVILEGDRLSELGRAVSIMDVARRAGALKIAIATREN